MRPIREISGGQVNNYFYRWSCVPIKATSPTSLNNNTPVNTEVLLLARPPSTDHGEQVVRSDDAVAVDICIRIIAAPGRNNCKHVIDTNQSIARDVVDARRNAAAGFTENTNAKKCATRVLASLFRAADGGVREDFGFTHLANAG